MHHRHFLENQGRGFISHVHIWYGRILIVIGIVNGGLGLDLSAPPNRFYIAYSVVAGVIGAAYLAVIVWKELRGARKPRTTEKVTPQSSHS
jgi:hypothetical protein